MLEDLKWFSCFSIFALVIIYIPAAYQYACRVRDQDWRFPPDQKRMNRATRRYLAIVFLNIILWVAYFARHIMGEL